MSRWVPPYPPRMIRENRTCPTGRPRFRTVDLARASIPSGAHIRGDATACHVCAGAHLDTEPLEPPA